MLVVRGGEARYAKLICNFEAKEALTPAAGGGNAAAAQPRPAQGLANLPQIYILAEKITTKSILSSLRWLLITSQYSREVKPRGKRLNGKQTSDALNTDVRFFLRLTGAERQRSKA